MDGGKDIVFERLDGDPTVFLPLNGLGDPGSQQGTINQDLLAGGIDDPEGVLVAAAGAGLPVEDVAPGDGVRPRGHQLALDLVLDLLDGGDGATRASNRQGGHDRVGDCRDSVGDHSGEGVGEGRADLGTEGHLDRVVDPAPIKGDLAPVALADASAGEVGDALARSGTIAEY